MRIRLMMGLLVDEDGGPLRGFNVRGFAHASDGQSVPLGYDTTDQDGAFAIEAAVDALRLDGLWRLRFEVLDGGLEPVHQVDDVVVDSPAAATAIRLIMPRPAPTAPEETSSDQEGRVAQIRVAPETAEVALGGRVMLVAEALDSGGNSVDGVPLQWQAYNDDGDEVPISSTGELVASASGRFTVAATAADQTGTAVVTVRAYGQDTGPVVALAPAGSGLGSRWNDTNAASAFSPRNRVGSGHAAVRDVVSTLGLRTRRDRVMDAETVGAANFMFSAPVISLPGRGMDVRLNLVYNARLWTRTNSIVEFDVDSGWPAPGWSLGFGRVVRLGSYGSMLVSPDGTRHPYQMVSLKSDRPGHQDFTGRTTDGTFIDYRHFDDPTGTSSRSAVANYPDGTSISYWAPGHDVKDPATGGIRRSSEVFPTRIEDANGNYITITYRNNVGPEIDTIADTLGRIIRFHYDNTSGYLTAITGPGLDGTQRTLVRFNIAPLPLEHTFSGLTAKVPNPTPPVIRAIYHPGDRSGYWFGETSSYSAYGMATKVTRHRGMGFDGVPLTETGTITPGTLVHQRSYNYPSAADPSLTDVPSYTQMTEVWEDMDTKPAVTSFSVEADSNPRKVAVTYPNGTRVVTLAHNRPPPPDGGLPSYAFDDGLPYQQDVFDGSRLLQSTTNVWEAGDYLSARLRRVETTPDNNSRLKTATEYDYGPYNRVIEVREFDFGATTVLRRTRTEYEQGTDYIRRHIFRLPSAVEVFHHSETMPTTRTEYYYDTWPMQDAPGVISHHPRCNPYAPDIWVPGYEEERCDDRLDPPCRKYYTDGYWEKAYDPGTRFRGNVTGIWRFADPAQRSGPVGEQRLYDITGNVVLTETGPYDRTVDEYTIATQYAHPSRHVVGSSAAQVVTSTGYDFGTGLMVSTTDPNGRTTSTEYDPASLRPTLFTWPTGATTTIFHDDPSRSVTETIRLADGSLAGRQTTFYNGLGLVRRTARLAGFADGDPTRPIDETSEHRYDEVGRVAAQASPYRSGDGAPWTEVFRDGLGRVVRTRAPDGSEANVVYDEQQRPDALAEIDPSAVGRTTRLVDAWGRQTWTWHNALGQLQFAVEPDPDGDGSVFSPASTLTHYIYNALNQVVWIRQLAPGSTGQNRRFRYDGLGRLTHQSLTERATSLTDTGEYRGKERRWSDVFSYVDADRLAWRMDARGVQTHFDYGDDPLGRLQAITYQRHIAPLGDPAPVSPPDPASNVRYDYVTDGDLTRLGKVTTDDMVKEYDYDAEGLLAATILTLADQPGRPFAVDYRYDTANRIRQLVYPAQYGLPGTPRKQVAFTYDLAGRIRDLTVDGVAHASEISYSAQGWPTELTIGSDSPFPTSEHNEPGPAPGLLGRQQVLDDGQSLLDLSYQYDRSDRPGITGQLVRAVDNLDPDRTTTYDYDATGRLRLASSGGDPATRPRWTQRYSYDRYGNRTHVTASGTAPDGSPIPQDGLSGLMFGLVGRDGLRLNESNRITAPAFVYDEAGNLTRGQRQDGTWQRYRYDAAGRLVAVTDDSGVSLETYTYGACRRRIRTRDEQANTELCHIWDQDSVIADYHTDATNTAWARLLVHLDKRLLCTFSRTDQVGRQPTETVRYHHPGRLGTRLITTPDTKEIAELATLPYGTLLGPTLPASETRIFTSYRRSPTTGLDYAANRDYDSQLGRSLQTDPLGLAGIDIGQPQTNNSFAYCRNDPINLEDPLGLRWIQVPGRATVCSGIDGGPQDCESSYYVTSYWVDELVTYNTDAGRLLGERRERFEAQRDRETGAPPVAAAALGWTSIGRLLLALLKLATTEPMVPLPPPMTLDQQLLIDRAAKGASKRRVGGSGGGVLILSFDPNAYRIDSPALQAILGLPPPDYL